ncbi:MAG: hypothetical protein PQJ46_01780, partial [Spirochaetales bacterium]|nr:hypothetical protein [Spirochaetales bacterium]
MKKIFCVFLIIFSITFSILAQTEDDDTSEETSEVETNTETIENDVDNETEEILENTDESDLIKLTIQQKTLADDIESSDYFELKSWCERIGLSTEGNIFKLKERLYKFYKIKEKKEDKKKNSRKIEIEKADNMEYFKIEQIDENYAKISGGVKLKLIDNVTNETHIIEADTILFNFKENTLTASGNIEYKIDSETKAEKFKGDKITFNIENYAGLFNKGITEQQTEVDGEDITFFLKGDQLNKTADNAVILNKGEITSCDEEDPHFMIKAQKIWLLTSTEWALFNGILYIGRVPVFYMPAFIYPSDKMIMNPAYGIKSDYGYFLQTTTYLLGESNEEDEDSMFTFMQNENADSYKKIDGIFLIEDEDPSPFSKALQDYGSTENYAKIILDAYSNFGFYSALDMSLNESGSSDHTDSKFMNAFAAYLSVVNSTDLYLSIAKTRKINESSGTYYYLFFDDDSGAYDSVWYNSYLYKLPLPFRYGFDYNTNIDFDWLELSVDMEAYSDDEYSVDFEDRTENLDLLSMLDSDTTTTDSTTGVDDYEWTAELSFNPDMSFFSPFIKTLKADIETDIYWDSDDIEDTSGDYDEYVDTFFYPEKYVLPKISN